jgi:hypothetical protein
MGEGTRKSIGNVLQDTHLPEWDMNHSTKTCGTCPFCHSWYCLSVSESQDIFGSWPQVNSRTFGYPSFPLLTQRYEITRDMYCTDEDICADGLFCACPYLYDVKLGNLVEIVFIDLGKLCPWSLMTLPCVITL